MPAKKVKSLHKEKGARVHRSHRSKKGQKFIKIKESKSPLYKFKLKKLYENPKRIYQRIKLRGNSLI